MNPSELPDEWSALLNGMAEETLTAEQEQRLADLLRSDIEFRREYVRFCQLLTLLTWQSAAGPTALKQPSPTSSIPASTTRSPRSWRTWATAAIAATVVMAVIGLTWLGLQEPGDDSLGTVADVVGQIGLTRGDDAQIWMGSEEHAQNPWQLRPGDRVQTDRTSSAALKLSDRTEIHMHPETQLVLTAGRGVTVRLSLGRVAARVTPQRPEQALTFVTSQAEVRVLGTELELLAAATRTEVAVAKGRVRVTRPSDGRSAEVAASQFLSVAESGDLMVVDVPQPPDGWSEDFEQGLPRGWTGQIVRDGLPENSHGAVGAVPVLHPEGMMREISSPIEDDGLFAWHADSVLHVSFRVQPPEWFHVYLFARPYRGRRPLLTYCCVKPDLWQTSPGQWRTVSIPFSEFHSVTYGQDEPTLGRIPTRLVFSGQGGPAGVVIDRVWVDRSDAPPDRRK
jgi:ferric-dicitrate binding protein FerR (iron transport regulator)